MFEVGDRRIHFLDVGQVGISPIARYLHLRGANVTGSARRTSEIVESLRRDGVEIIAGTSPDYLDDVDVLVVSAESSDYRLEIEAARIRNVEIVSPSALLVEVLRGVRTIGVTGTHGKGTVASMVAWILEKAGLAPGFIIGGMVNNFGTNARVGAGEWLVIEIDESEGIEHPIYCDYVICNFVELDHLNVYSGLEDVIEAMTKFLESNSRLKEVFINLDCLGNRQMVEDISLRPTGYATEHRSEFRAELMGPEDGPIRFRAFHRDISLGDFELNVQGRYNVVNALGAIALCWRLRVDEDVIAEALKSYRGLRNRYAVTRGGGVSVVKDYTSHPTGIRSVLDSARHRVDRRLYCVFKPYLYSMIDNLQAQYGKAFLQADEVIVTRTYSEDGKSADTAAESLAERIRAEDMDVTYLPNQEMINEYLLEVLEPGDKVIFFGKDDLLEQADHLQAELARRAAQTEADEEQPRLDGPLAEGGE